MATKLRNNVEIEKGFWKINAIRPINKCYLRIFAFLVVDLNPYAFTTGKGAAGNAYDLSYSLLRECADLLAIDVVGLHPSPVYSHEEMF